jgi:N-acetylglucosaminyldiphosphoundecaprenol N-acetyl-beta-D-mannosaminyltransferase
MNTVRVFGLPVYTGGKKRLLEDMGRIDGKTHIISGSAEVLKLPLSNEAVYQQFADTRNIIIPDGISLYYAAKKKDRHCEKIPGIDFMRLLLEEFQKTGKSAYFLGAKETVIERLIPCIKEAYPRLKTAGYHNGYFDKENCADIIADIKQSGAFALFAALGTPAQEKFIFDYMDELPCKIFMGVGGSFDVLSGTVKRSPKWMRGLGLEWFYRLLCDPSKADRFWHNVKFTVKAFLFG